MTQNRKRFWELMFRFRSTFHGRDFWRASPVEILATSDQHGEAHVTRQTLLQLQEQFPDLNSVSDEQ